MMAWFLSDALPWLIGGAAALFTLILGVFAIRRDARRETALESAERYTETRKRMDDADQSLADDPAVLRDFLRDRGTK